MTVKRCKEVVERKKYNELTANIAGFENKGEVEKRHAKQESQFTMMFGFGFITMMFLGFVSGYFVGTRILEWDPLPSMFISLAVGITTLLVEAFLMIFRIQKLDKAQAMERKRIKLE